MRGSYLTREHLDKAVEILSNPPPAKHYILLFGHYENLLRYGIKRAFINPVDGGLVIVAKNKEEK